MNAHTPPPDAPTPTESAQRNFSYTTAGIWVIATVAIGYALHEGRAIMAPFALAVFVFLVMEGLARSFKSLSPKIPNWLAHTLAIGAVVVSIVIFISVMRNAIVQFAEKSDGYEARINELIAQVYSLFGLSDAPQLSQLIFSDESVRFVEPAIASVQGMAGDLVIILIYVAFLYLASTGWSRHMDNIFRHPDGRAKAHAMGEDVRRTMEQYLWVQTALSIITTALTYVSLLACGLDNALFWAFVIFFLNYIPTIGSIVATVLPALFAVVQPDWPAWMPSEPLYSAGIVFLAVAVWQFVIGNFVGPRMMGESLNLSPLVVLLSLAVWGALWGLPGMFLSAPLTVLIMIVLSTVPGARWIAILLSEDGDPKVKGAAANLPAPAAEASRD